MLSSVNLWGSSGYFQIFFLPWAFSAHSLSAIPSAAASGTSSRGEHRSSSGERGDQGPHIPNIEQLSPPGGAPPPPVPFAIPPYPPRFLDDNAV